uniref:Chaperone DnaJ C-terminal domain-containing protein n=1 Tax=viral metagenome TaxID=1070528 RepID=A0A6C0LFL9_9ZZZZ
MEMYYSILGANSAMTPEDIKTAFRQQTLNNNENFDNLAAAYNHIISNKEVIEIPNINEVLSSVVSGVSGGSGESDVSHKIDAVLNNLISNIFQPTNNKTENIFKDISINDVYMNVNIGEFLNIDDLKHIYISELNLNGINEFTITDHAYTTLYKITLNLKNDSHFDITDDGHLFFKKCITLKEALCGFEFTFEHLDGKTFTLKNTKAIIHPKSEIKLPSMGINKQGQIGDLIIKFDVLFPEELSDIAKSTFSDLL